jgi:hypothetical protein
MVATSEEFVGAGAGEVLEFNVDGAVTITNLTANVIVGPAPDHASAFGPFCIPSPAPAGRKDRRAIRLAHSRLTPLPIQV